jgi:hypothetical protein
VAPDDDGNRQQQKDPELASERLRIMPGVLVAGRVRPMYGIVDGRALRIGLMVDMLVGHRWRSS